MKRNHFISDLQEVVLELSEGNVDSDEAQANIDEISSNFCDHYESKFKGILDELEAIKDHVPAAEAACDLAYDAASDLY